MSDDIELPYGPLSFVSRTEFVAVKAERDKLRTRVNRALDVGLGRGSDAMTNGLNADGLSDTINRMVNVLSDEQLREVVE